MIYFTIQAMSNQIEATLSKKLKNVFGEMADRANEGSHRFNGLAESTDKDVSESHEEMSNRSNDTVRRVATFFAEV